MPQNMLITSKQKEKTRGSLFFNVKLAHSSKIMSLIMANAENINNASTLNKKKKKGSVLFKVHVKQK